LYFTHKQCIITVYYWNVHRAQYRGEHRVHCSPSHPPGSLAGLGALLRLSDAMGEDVQPGRAASGFFVSTLAAPGFPAKRRERMPPFYN
jgi:hypothetical protein